MKLPVGIQSFEKIRTQNFIYVDKTEYIYQLAHNNVPYFLSRPRRFGKSLLLSTMKAYWEGRRDLFQGLKIEELENCNPEAWQKYPVFCFDFNGKNYQETNALEDVLQAMLAEWGEEYGVDPSLPIEMQFKQLLKKAHEKTGKRCVVLVDEYDKPLLETLEKKNLTEHNKALFKGFFSNLKSEDAHLQFVFITGVTKFSKVSIFSDLNQLHDISLVKEYAGLCGISRTELEEYFAPEIEALAKEQGDTREKCLERLRQRYDGYRFHEQGCGIFNPYSILTAFADKEFGAYWFATGTPGFLVKRLKEISFDVRKFTDGTLYASKRMLSDYRDDNPDPIPLLYQTGYLTLKEYIREREVYILGFPNEEVKYAFLESMLPVFVDGVCS